MEVFIQVSFFRMRFRVKANMCGQTAKHMKVNGLMIKQTGMESMYMLTALDMKVHGKMIFNMVKVRKVGQITVAILVNIFAEKNMGLVCIVGVMAVNMMVNGSRIKLKV